MVLDAFSRSLNTGCATFRYLVISNDDCVDTQRSVGAFPDRSKAFGS